MAHNDTLLPPQQVAALMAQIDTWDHETIARKLRFGKSGDPLFDNRYPLYDHLQSRFKSLGGWSPELSKRIGW